jgi:hypothetical protein
MHFVYGMMVVVNSVRAKVNDPHDPLIGVVAILPMFPDRGTGIGAVPS